MNFKKYIGEKVIAKDGREGTIVGIEDNNALIKFQEADPKSFGAIAFENGFLSFEKNELQEEVESEKQQAEQREVERKAKQEAAIERNKNNHKIEVGQRIRGNGKSAKINYDDLYYEGMELIQDQVYGTNSKVIYENICKYLGWNKDLSKIFGNQGLGLYAEKATPESYSVWFINNSNITDTHSKNRRNIISSDGKTIETRWDDEETIMYEGEPRVIFVMQKNKTYVFYGFYKCIKVDWDARKGYFEIVKNKYPL